MIIYSIVPMEEIFSTNQWQCQEQFEMIKLDNIEMEVRLVGRNLFEIQRIYSTNPMDYLKPSLQPGVRLKGHYSVDA
jgi:hypothetical protein